MWPDAEAKADAWRADIILDYHLSKQLPELMLPHFKPLPHQVGPATKRSIDHTFAFLRQDRGECIRGLVGPHSPTICIACRCNRILCLATNITGWHSSPETRFSKCV